MDSVQALPLASELSPSVLFFLERKFDSRETLEHAPSLVSELERQCSDLDKSLIDLNQRLGESLNAHSLFSNRIHGLFTELRPKLRDLESSSRSQASESDGEAGHNVGRAEQIMGEELPALAKEVARMERVRIYAETAMKLDTMVGDIEDAVSSTINKHLRKHSSAQNSEDVQMHAIKSIKLTEDVLKSITKDHPDWTRLVSAVDHRVDRALAILRPQAIADYRSLLTTLGWPPPLSTLTSTNNRKSSEVPNPLFAVQGNLKKQYCVSFVALCSLQGLQRRRKSRQLEGFDREVDLHQPLWAVEELVNPISLASQRHFSKWIDKPEFIFALVYKITRDYVDSMDELLQPLVDEAMLTGYSCREEWISAMVSSLATYLAKEVFPSHLVQPDQENVTRTRSEARTSWLHLIDEMISFDKRIKSLVEQSGVFLSFQDDRNMRKFSSLSVFCDRPDWLDLWADLELNDALDKLKPEADDERNWIAKVQIASLSSSSENYKSPLVSRAFIQSLSCMIDRCKSLPSISSRSRFLSLTCTPIITKFLDCMLIRCLEAEGLTALTDDDALVKVVNSINASRYFESVLREWSEDVFFLEMGLEQGDPLEVSPGRANVSSDIRESGIIDQEIEKLEEFRTEWVEKIIVVILRGFDAECREYIKNRRQWLEKAEEGWNVSKSLVGALDYLQGKMSVLEENMNGIDFVGFWRSLASGVDRLIYNGILMSNAKFNDDGVERFSSDLEVLFTVFRAWCLRPEGFFPKASEGLKLLKMHEEQLRNSLVGGEKWMKENGVTHLSVAEVEKIVKSRTFSG